LQLLAATFVKLQLLLYILFQIAARFSAIASTVFSFFSLRDECDKWWKQHSDIKTQLPVLTTM
jgi:hypothetical protein